MPVYTHLGPRFSAACNDSLSLSLPPSLQLSITPCACGWCSSDSVEMHSTDSRSPPLGTILDFSSLGLHRDLYSHSAPSSAFLYLQPSEGKGSFSYSYSSSSSSSSAIRCVPVSLALDASNHVLRIRPAASSSSSLGPAGASGGVTGGGVPLALDLLQVKVCV